MALVIPSVDSEYWHLIEGKSLQYVCCETFKVNSLSVQVIRLLLHL